MFHKEADKRLAFRNKLLLTISQSDYFQHFNINILVLTLSDNYIILDKFSYITYEAFLKYLYTGTIDLSVENILGKF